MTVKSVPLEQVARIYSGSNLKSGQNAFGEGGCPWVMVEDLNNGELETTSRSLSEEGMGQAKISPAGTVFCSSTGTIGKVGIAEVPMAPSNNMIALEFDQSQVEPLYGMYCLLAMREALQAEAGGAVYASLRLSVFRKFRIPVPDPEVQNVIAGKLTMLRKGQWQQRLLMDKVKQAMHALFESCFGREVKQAIKEQRFLALEEATDILLNGAIKKRSSSGTSVRYVATPQLDDWEVQGAQAPQLEAETQKLELYYLHEGDIVMNRINGVERLGKCGIMLEEPKEPCVFGQNTLRIRAERQLLEPLFLFAWLTHPYVKQYIRKNAKNSTSFQSSLSKQVLTALPLLEADLTKQRTYSQEIRRYFSYIRTAEEIKKAFGELQQIWYDRIHLLLHMGEGEPEDAAAQKTYQEGRYWIAPSGTLCFYDSVLECIQVPWEERGKIRLSQLPPEVEIQFLDKARRADGKSRYGFLGQIRLKRTGSDRIHVIRMEPVAYRPEQKQEEDRERELEENGIISEQQDFGYIRRMQAVENMEDESAEAFLSKYSPEEEKGYSRFERLPASARTFVSRLSAFQQAVFEEFLLAMQPLACHMVGKQVSMRLGKEEIPGYGIQDVIAAVRLLEHGGLLEKRQGLYLDYDEDYRQGEKRRQILDHRGKPIPIDTWICADVKEQRTDYAAGKG